MDTLERVDANSKAIEFIRGYVDAITSRQLGNDEWAMGYMAACEFILESLPKKQ